MFPQQPQQQFSKAGADVQLFYRDSGWTKPPGVSHVYMMLIGHGGEGDGAEGGGSGAVTVWYGAAQHVPDNLVVTVPVITGFTTAIRYRSAAPGQNTLLTALSGVANAGAAATAANQFAASGFYKSTAGQNGISGGQTASATTFLSGGNNVNGVMTSNYGYSKPAGNTTGFFMLQPMIVGMGGSDTSNGGIGCGSGSSGAAKGGPALVIIASW
jgi:hypothetical protein